ncbi:MAG: alpha/beta hydrolase [Myxococcota bacterium]
MVRVVKLLLPLALLAAGGWALSEDGVGVERAPRDVDLRLAPVAAVPTTASCDLRPRYAEAAVRVEDDLPYAPRDGWARRMDVALPPGPGPHPGVLLFHAGGWANGSEDDLRHRIVQLATHGFAAASVRYRLANRPAARRHPAQVSDARCAARTFAARTDIDGSQLVAAGFSAGGHLASMLAVAPEVPLDDGSCPLSGPVPRFRGGISYYGVLDLRREAPVGAYTHRIIDNFLGRGLFGAEPELRSEASPVVHLDPRDPPLLVAHGDADDVVSVEVGRAFRDAAAQARVRINYLELEGAGHGFAFLGGSDVLRRVDCTALRFLRARIGGGDSGATAARQVPSRQRGG